MPSAKLSGGRSSRIFDFALYWSPSIIAAIFLIATCAFLIATSNLGLDVTDEGFYLLAMRYPQDVSGCSTFFYMYGALPFSLVDYDIASYRILGLLAILTSSAFFGVQSFKMLSGKIEHSTRSNTGYIAIFSMLGGTLFYSWFLRAPSYNLFSSVGIMLSLGMFFQGISSELNFRRRAISFFVCGFFLGFSAFCKCTAAALVFFSILCIILVEERKSKREKVVMVQTIISGGMFWVAIHIGAICSWNETVRIFENGFSYVTALGSGYGWTLIHGYADQLAAAIGRALWHFKWAFCMLSILVITSAAKRFSLLRNFRTPVICIVLLVGVVCAALNRHDFGGLTYLNRILSAWAAWMLLLFGLVVYEFLLFGKEAVKMPERIKCISIIFLFLLPFISSVGTNNHITQNALFLMAPWLVLIGIMTISLSRSTDTVVIKVFLAVIFGALCMGQIYHAGMQNPYRQSAPITKHQFPAAYSDIRLDKGISKYFNELSELCIKSGFKRGDDILALYSQPGIVLLLGGRSPGMPWYSDAYSGFKQAQELAFFWAGSARLRNSFILIRPDRVDELRASFLNVGICFSDEYQLCGEISCPLDSPIMQLWKPVGRLERPHH